MTPQGVGGRDEMIDRYTKGVLTVIAGALVAIAVQGMTPTAKAQLGRSCGMSAIEACYVRTGDTFMDVVQVTVR